MIFYGQSVPQGFIVEQYVNGLNLPTQLVQAPDGRIFVAEKGGRIMLIENDVLLEQPFYVVDTETPGERGVTGLVLHPDFDSNGFVYIYFTIPNTNRNRLIRVQAIGNTAPPSSEEVIFEFDEMYAAWHNGGGMVFSDDGKIILGVGDGTGWQSAQQEGSILGKVVRINDDGSIPDDNPFPSFEGHLGAIAAIGVRNPYTMAKQESSGRILFVDIGVSTWEELNEYVPGVNYGWGDIEGPIEVGVTPPENYMDPIYAYNHDNGCAIVGSSFYEPELTQFPEQYYGKFLFLEHCHGEIFVFDVETGDVELFAAGFQLPNTILTLDDGSLLLCEIYNGRILKISFEGNGPPSMDTPQNFGPFVPGDSTLLAVNVSGNPPFQISWRHNEAPLENSNSSTLELLDIQLEDNGDFYVCEATNQFGTTTSDTMFIHVIDESRPVITFLEPIDEFYEAGDTLFFSAEVFDNEDGLIPSAEFEWDIDFHHNVHKHPALNDYNGFSSGFYVIPDQGETATDVWLRVKLKVVDSSGLITEEHIDVHPHLVEVVVETWPSGLDFFAEGSLVDTGYVYSVRDMLRTFSASPYYIENNRLWKFENWENGSSNLDQTIFAQDTTLEFECANLHEYIEGKLDEKIDIDYFIGTDSRELFDSRLIETVDGNWNLDNPILWSPIPQDDFSVTYEGSLLAPWTGLYEFDFYHDGQVKFWLQDSVLYEEVRPNGVQDSTSVSVNLEAGQFYDFTLDYEHYVEFSRVQWRWKFSELPKEIVPDKQLFKRGRETQEIADFDIWPTIVEDRLYLNLSDLSTRWGKADAELSLYDASGRIVRRQIIELIDQDFPFAQTLKSGIYYVVVQSDGRKAQATFFRN